MSRLVRLQSTMTSGRPNSVQLLRTGDFTDMFGSEVSVTAELLRNLEQGFRDNVGMIENTTGLPVNYSHNAGSKAAGWIRDVRLAGDDSQLWIDVDWTPAATEALEAGEFKFISAEFMGAGEGRRPQLLGAGLTNIPAVVGMAPISLSQFTDEQQRSLAEQLIEQFNLQPTKEQTMAEENKTESTPVKAAPQEAVALARDEAELVALQSQLAEARADIAKLQAGRIQLQREAEFEKLLAEEKAVPAQREAYLAGDVVAFAAGAMALHTSPSGVNADGKEKGSMSEEDAIVKLSAAAKEIAKSEGMEEHRAYERALLQNPEIARMLNQK